MTRTLRILLLTSTTLFLSIATASTSGVLGTAGAATPRFHLVFSSQFNGGGLKRATWTQFNGTDGCCAMTLWRRTHIHVRRGMLTLNTSRDPAVGNKWVTAGVSMGRSLNQTYGRWNVRFRMNAGRGTAFCLMLWPKQGWPPEIDFAEEGPGMGAARRELTSTLHYGHNTMVHHHTTINLAKWHVLGVRWTPGEIRYTIDGRVWATITGKHVPSQPMHLAIQSEVGPKGHDNTKPNSSTPAHVKLQVDYVHIYRYG